MQPHPLANIFRKKLVRLGGIWAKSKSCIHKNIRSPAATLTNRSDSNAWA